MQQRPLGNTGMTVSPLGYGAFKIGRNLRHHFADDYPLPTDDEVEVLFDQLHEAGVNLIDTAPAYGLSEQRVSRAMGHHRDHFILATKVGEEFTENGSVFDYSATTVRRSIERSLSRLRTDWLDLVCVHSNGNDVAIQQETDVVETLLELKRRGDIRAVGFSGKTIDGARAAIEWADVLMVTYNTTDPSHEAVIGEASAAGVGVIVKKGLASGRLAPEQGIPFVLEHPGVSSLLVSSVSPSHLETDIAIAGRCLAANNSP